MIHKNCGGEIVTEREETRETLFGTMSVRVSVDPWCRKCGYKVRPEFIDHQSGPVLSAEEGAKIKAQMEKDYPWLK